MFLFKNRIKALMECIEELQGDLDFVLRENKGHFKKIASLTEENNNLKDEIKSLKKEHVVRIVFGDSKENF